MLDHVDRTLMLDHVDHPTEALICIKLLPPKSVLKHTTGTIVFEPQFFFLYHTCVFPEDGLMLL